MASDHSRAVKVARRSNGQLANLFGKLGTREHPGGGVLRAYRAARGAVPGLIDTPGNLDLVFSQLRRDVRRAVSDVLAQAVLLGRFQAEREIDIYKLPPIFAPPVSPADIALEAVLLHVDTQAQAVRTLAATGTLEVEAVIGDGTRTGLLTPVPVVREAARWTTAAAISAWAGLVKASLASAGAEDDYLRQAIAGIDERTTDCCLRVHAQTVGIDEQFTLTGTPRYADKQDGPGFHDYCRTSVVLVRAGDANDDLTEEMRDAAKSELKFRADIGNQIDDIKRQLADEGAATDIRPRQDDSEKVTRLRTELRKLQQQLKTEIHPASATSRR